MEKRNLHVVKDNDVCYPGEGNRNLIKPCMPFEVPAKRRHNLRAIGAIVISCVVGGGAVLGVNAFNRDSDHQSVKEMEGKRTATVQHYEDVDPNAYIDSNIDSIYIGKGANIRKRPCIGTPDDRTFLTETGKAFVIKLDPEDKVIVKDGERNGSWYGVNKEDVIKQNKSLEPKLESDDDGTVWINEQGCEVEYR